MIREKISVSVEKQEYPDMTFAQLQRMVELMNQGISEEEAKARALNND